MGPGFEADEVGWDDQFHKAMLLNPRYVGKYYASQDTEVLSMGVEKLLTDPVHFAKEDPEYFKLVVGILSGRLL